MLPFDPSELTRYGGLSLLARRVVEGILTGAHPSPFEGHTAEVVRHRHYHPGDDPRRIDWRASGRTGRLHVKQFEETTNRPATVVLDASGSMRYKGRAGASKFGFAQQVAASLGYLLLAQSDAVGLVIHDVMVRTVVPPKTGSKQLLWLLRGLEDAVPGGESRLAEVWHELAVRRLRRPGLVVILSDCFDQARHLARALRHLRRRKHEVLLFHLLAPEEIEFPFDRPTRFRDLERLGTEVRGDARRLRVEYRRNFEEHRSELVRASRELGVDYHLLRTDESIDRALGVYLARRKK
jgi:uncharacterized protein (DUF58 family)